MRLHYLPLAVITLALAACATPKPPEPIVRVQEVKVEVRVPCKPVKPAETAYPADAVDLGSNLFVLVKALLEERELRKEMETKLRGAIASCE